VRSGAYTNVCIFVLCVCVFVFVYVCTFLAWKGGYRHGAGGNRTGHKEVFLWHFLREEA
jgi:hypothetical protein